MVAEQMDDGNENTEGEQAEVCPITKRLEELGAERANASRGLAKLRQDYAALTEQIRRQEMHVHALVNRIDELERVLRPAE